MPVDGTMLQEEALLIAEKLGKSGLQPRMDGYNVLSSVTTFRKWLCGRGRGCERGNAGKLERARK